MRVYVLKRVVILAYDAISALVVAFAFACIFALPAYAYIDPSVMTYTIQAVAGVAVALSTVLGVVLRRGRKTLMRVLDIDENAHRVVEPDVHRLDADGNIVYELVEGAMVVEARVEETIEKGAESGDGVIQVEGRFAPEEQQAEEQQTDAQRADAPVPEMAVSDGLAPDASPCDISLAITPDSADENTSKPAKRRQGGFTGHVPYKPSWKERLAYGAIVAFFFVFTIYFVAPLEIVHGGASDLVFSMGDVWWVLVGPCLGIAAGITLVLSLLRGRAFNIVLMVVAAVGVAAYVQALFMNVGLPAADGSTIVWDDYLAQSIVSSVIWIVIITAAVAISVIHAKRAQGIAAILAIFLVIVQGAGLVSLAIGDAMDASSATDGKGGKVLMTEDQLFTVNSKHNVIVFVLDTFDTAYLRRILGMNPNLLDGLTGFTNYENATSAMIPTRFAIPEMMTGQMPGFDEPFSTYKDERYARGTFLDDIYDANYSIGLYTDSLRISALSEEERASITGKTVNMHDMPDTAMDFGGTLYSLYTMGQYRDVLWPFKWAFWYYTDEINQWMVVSDDDSPPEETIYLMDDIRYYKRLNKFGLSIEDGDYSGAYRFIHLLGSHYPFNYDEDVNDLGEDNSDVFKQSQGAIKIVTTYIDQLKQLGVYENTTIIITADHGYWTITLEPIEETSTPIMFVKPEQSAEEDSRPIKVDEKPVSHLDLQATVLDAMGLDWSEYANRDEWAGYSMLRSIDPARVRYYLTTDSEPDLTEVQFREYCIDGNALDWANWSETGRTIDAQN